MSDKERNITLYRAGSPKAPLVILNTLGNEGTAVFERVGFMGSDVSMATIRVEWNADLSPWKADPVRKDDPPFSGGADDYLDELIGSVIPKIIDDLGDEPSYIVISGYSLAGLFSLYALYKTDIFTRAVCASGSFWFPGFLDFALANDMKIRPGKIYFSLGDKEAKTGNRVMRSVKENTERLYSHFIEMGIECRYDINRGDHFTDTVERMAKGIVYAIS